MSTVLHFFPVFMQAYLSPRFTTCVSLWAPNAALRNVYVYKYHRVALQGASLFLSLFLLARCDITFYIPLCARFPGRAFSSSSLAFSSSRFFESLLQSSWHSEFIFRRYYRHRHCPAFWFYRDLRSTFLEMFPKKRFKSFRKFEGTLKISRSAPRSVNKIF